jgi:hypothetical protein
MTVAQLDSLITLLRSRPAPAVQDVGQSRVRFEKMGELLMFHWCYFLGSADLCLGRTVRAMNMLRHSVELNAQWPFSHFVLASALAHAGLLAEAAEAADSGLRLAPQFTIARLRAQVIGTNPIYLAQRERLYEGLKLAGVPVE